MHLRADMHVRIEALARASAPPTRDFHSMPLADVIDHLLTTHHQTDRAELERATNLASKVHRVHGSRHAELARVEELVTGLRDELLVHMMKEEQVLFPFIRALEDGSEGAVSIACPITCMRAEHDDARAVLAELRALTHEFAPPFDACGSYRALYGCLEQLEEDLNVHIHLENEILFPRALDLSIGAGLG